MKQFKQISVGLLLSAFMLIATSSFDLNNESPTFFKQQDKKEKSKDKSSEKKKKKSGSRTRTYTPPKKDK